MLLKMSMLGGILILLTLTVRSFAINKLPKGIFILLWDIVLLRLLVPVHLPFHYGIATSINKIQNISMNYLSNANHTAAQEDTKRITVDTTSAYLNHILWSKIVWITGMILLLVAFGILYWKEYRKLQAALPVSQETENKYKAITAIPKRTKVFVSDRIPTPLTFGIFCPKIILPKLLPFADEIEQKYVLTHEAIHIKRRDNLSKIIMLLVLCIHWFNPLVWVMYVFFNRDIELSCDEKVIHLLGEKTKKEYAMTLVNLAEKQYNWSFFATGFGKNAIQERIVAIMKYKKLTITSIICAVILLGTGITVFANEQNSDQELSIGTFYKASEDGNELTDDNFSAGTFYDISDNDTETPAEDSSQEASSQTSEDSKEVSNKHYSPGTFYQTSDDGIETPDETFSTGSFNRTLDDGIETPDETFSTGSFNQTLDDDIQAPKEMTSASTSY